MALEDIATPLTAVPAVGEAAAAATHPMPGDAERREALRSRELAHQARARSSEHRARVHELRAARGSDNDMEERIKIEQALAEIGQLRAQVHDERAVGHDERAAAEETASTAGRAAALARARAANERAIAGEQQAAALSAESQPDADRYRSLAGVAAEGTRADEQRAQADQARGEPETTQGPARELALTRAEMYEAWAVMREARATAGQREAEGDHAAAERLWHRAKDREELAPAAEERVHAAEHLTQAEHVRASEQESDDTARRPRTGHRA